MAHIKLTDETTVEDLMAEGWTESDARKLLKLRDSVKRVDRSSNLPQMPPPGPRQIPPHIPSTEYYQPTDDGRTEDA